MTFFFKKIYTIYAVLVFLFWMIVLFPFYFIIIRNKKWHRHNHKLNRIWARAVSIFIFLPFETEYRAKPDPKRQYIYCPNHFSYFDIAAMVFTPSDFQYAGKSSLAKAPGLGYIFKNLHITVDRFSPEGRKAALNRYYEALDNGKSLVVFPEGGIYAKNPPQMAEFKHGPFRAAIMKKTPIVPVTIPYNWIILPDDGKYLLKRRRCKVIYHEPIETKDLTIDDIDLLKDKVYRIIQEELLKQNKHHENRQGNPSENRPLSQAGL